MKYLIVLLKKLFAKHKQKKELKKLLKRIKPEESYIYD